MAAGALLVYSLGLGQFGMKIVGNVPKGLPALSLLRFNLETISLLLPDALTILFVGFVESISVAKLIAAKEKYKFDANQELKGLGLVNIFASLFSAYPVTGGFSRTAVNYQAGARIGLASIVTAGLIRLILLFFTPLFYYLPNAVLASIVMVAVTGLVDVKEVKRLLRLKKVDGWTLILTFMTTLVFGSEKGIFVGVAFSLLVFIWRSSHPYAAELGYLEKEGVFRNIKRYPEAKIYPGTFILRVDASLYFANMGFLEDVLRKDIADKPETQWVILDLSGVNDMDGVAVDALEEIMNSYKGRDIQFLFAGMKGPVRDLVAKPGWEDKFGTSIQSPSIQHALERVKSGRS